MLPIPSAHSVALGRITNLETDGSATVETEFDTAVRCVVLECAATRRPLVGGDLVVVLRGTSSDDLGVVLGRPALSNEPPVATSTAEAPLSSLDRPESLVIEATEELTLRVGDGSITIRKDGKILIKGKDLVSHAQRMNRIKGGSVSIN